MVTLGNMDNLQETRQQVANVNPPHTDTTKIPYSTPWDVRFGLTLLPARYLIRSVTEWGAKGLPNISSQSLFNRINSNLMQMIEHRDTLFNGGAVPSSIEDIVSQLSQSELGRGILATNHSLHKRWGATDIAHNTMEYFCKSLPKAGAQLTGSGGITIESMRRIQSRMAGPWFELLYDNGLGIGGLAYTYRVQSNVVSDMRSVYSEAVGYEKNTDPSTITDDDIFSSSNRIIQSTVENYRSKQWKRIGISAIPFIRNIPGIGSPKLGDCAIGLWGALWAYDVWGREPTMLENFMNFINDKLNPLYGISDRIKPSDIINLYQQYAYRFAPEQAFRSISMNDPDANRMWALSEKLFVRIADLMNQSYNYKHTTEIDPQTNKAMIYAEFTMPKFIYLLGHGHINARQPEWSMAYIEIANRFGMEAVKEVAKAQRNGAEIGDVLRKYPVNLNPTDHVNGTGQTAKLSSPQALHDNAMPADQKSHTAAPATIISADSAHSEPTRIAPSPAVAIAS